MGVTGGWRSKRLLFLSVGCFALGSCQYTIKVPGVLCVLTHRARARPIGSWCPGHVSNNGSWVAKSCDDWGNYVTGNLARMLLATYKITGNSTYLAVVRVLFRGKQPPRPAARAVLAPLAIRNNENSVGYSKNKNIRHSQCCC